MPPSFFADLAGSYKLFEPEPPTYGYKMGPGFEAKTMAKPRVDRLPHIPGIGFILVEGKRALFPKGFQMFWKTLPPSGK